MTDDQEQAVRDRAFALWESEGRPHGREEAHWHQARRELGIEQLSAVEASARNNRGRRAAETSSGEVTGSGAGAGGGGNAEDFDSDPQSGGGTLPQKSLP